MSLGPLRVPRIPAPLFAAALNTAGTFDSGIVLTAGAGFEHAAFQLIPGAPGTTPTGFSAKVYGTLDPGVLLNIAGVANVGQGGIGSLPNPNYPAPGANGGAWFLLPAPSEQASTGTVVNPLTAITQVLESKVPCLAYWVQVTITAPVNTANVVGWTID